MVFFYFIHRLYFNKITMFRKLDLLLSSGKKGRTETLAVGPPGLASLRPGPVLRLILLKYRWWTKSKRTLLQVNSLLHFSVALDLAIFRGLRY
jgi:hypothetical protein